MGREVTRRYRAPAVVLKSAGRYFNLITRTLSLESASSRPLKNELETSGFSNCLCFQFVIITCSESEFLYRNIYIFFICELQCNEALLMENERLQSELKDATHKLGLLQNQVNAMQQNTVTFILEQMDTLKMQKVTEV